MYSMGTAILTRSRSRKPRSVYSSGATERGLCSPFELLPGNNLDSTSRRRKTRPSNISKFLEKENAPPSGSKDGNSHPGEEKKGVVDSCLQKSIKKRKQPIKGLTKHISSTNVVGDTFDTLTPIENDVWTALNTEMDVNSLKYETCTEVKLDSSKIPSAATTCAQQEDQARRLLSQGSCECDTAMETVANPTAVKRNEGPSDQKGVDQNAVSGSSCLALLQKEYEKLFMKYQKLKARRQDEVEALYSGQNSRIADFVRATEALLEFYKRENDSLRQQFEETNIPTILNKCTSLEKANVDCRDDLLQEQSKSLELTQENRRLKSLLLKHIDEQKQVPVQGSPSGKFKDLNRRDGDTFVQKLLGCVLGLQLTCTGDEADASLHFHHCPTGFSFTLKQVHDVEIADLIGGGEFSYQNVSVGACKRAMDWMKEKEVVFGMDQAQLLFKRLIGFLNTGFCGRYG